MIIIADVPYIDAFNYAIQSAQDRSNLCFFEEEIEEGKSYDIFSSISTTKVGFACNISTDAEVSRLIDWLKNIKICICWNCKTEKLKKIFSLKNLAYKEVSIPNYVNLNMNIEKIKKDIDANFYNSIIKESSILPLPEKVSRDIASNILHKIAIIKGGNNYACYYSDIVGKINFSFIDMTDVFCKSADDFLKFCNYYFDKKEAKEMSSYYAWVHIIYCLSLSDFQVNHEKIKEIKYLSPKIIQVISEKVSNLVNENSRAYFNYALSIIHNIENIENSIIATTFLRKSISVELSKKITINMIRSFNE